MNAFYASVECLYHPELREQPVAVCGDEEQRHGIVLAKNERAKMCGVKTGETIWQAKLKCRELVTLNARYDLYMKFSQAARAIYSRYTDRIESFGLDECWLDLSGCVPPGSGRESADELRQVIKNELGVTISVGVSWNRIFAKLGSDMKKPDAVTTISKENFRTKVFPLPASDLLYVGPATTKKLSRYGIHTIGGIAGSDPAFLHSLLGKWGETLWSFANGYDVSPVAHMDSRQPIKSIGNSMTTWRDIVNFGEAFKVITVLSESVARRLRESGFRCRTVQLSVRDTELSWFERQAKLEHPTCISSEIADVSMSLLRENWDFSLPLRSLGVRACTLEDSRYGIQVDFFGRAAKSEKLEKLESSVDEIRRRFGGGAITRAVLLGDDITHDHDPLTHEIHPVAYSI